MNDAATKPVTDVTCTMFNKLTQNKLGDVRLLAVPRPGDHIVARRTVHVLEVWHVAGKGIFLLVEETPQGLPAYMRNS